MAGCLACILLLFALPLAAQATNHFRREERETLGRNLTAPDNPGVTGEPTLPNPSALLT
uniref:hypothetical protein n=1 Tax=Azospirillum argentinense TaxID=2970906 RepID=UPI001585D7F6|nr:hypothetical protein [Azospirillum argentinense]